MKKTQDSSVQNFFRPTFWKVFGAIAATVAAFSIIFLSWGCSDVCVLALSPLYYVSMVLAWPSIALMQGLPVGVSDEVFILSSIVSTLLWIYVLACIVQWIKTSKYFSAHA